MTISSNKDLPIKDGEIRQKGIVAKKNLNKKKLSLFVPGT